MLMRDCYERNGKILIAGNGGSASDSEHFAGELMKKFKIPRPVPDDFSKKLLAADPVRGKELSNRLERCLTAVPLVAHEAMSTAFLNDVDGYDVFAQQLYGFGRLVMSLSESVQAEIAKILFMRQ